MWSGDPQESPPAGPPPAWAGHRPHKVAYVFAVVMPLVLALAMVAPWGVARLVAGSRSSAASTSADQPGAGSGEGGSGAGDPYFPDYGSSGYDALSYTISVSWAPGSQTLTGTTVMKARATSTLTSFFVDLALTAQRVTVDGQPAAVRRFEFADLRVTPVRPIPAGAEFQVTTDYSGQPGRIKRGGTSAWWVSGQEWTAAGEPESSAWWFPADDHPSDPALMDVSVRVPAGLTAVSVGRLASRDTGHEADYDTWHWVAEQPMATYLNFVSIGRFELQQGVVDGRPYVYAVSAQLPIADRRRAFAVLARSGAIVRVLESMFGPYPFPEVGGVVPATKLGFAGLETQTRPIYERAAVLDERSADILLAHELAHMWFGDNVTLRRWDDIFDNEGYASWAQWGYAERTGGRSANDAFRALYERLKNRPGFWRVTMIDPGRDHLFDAVYLRGPMLLQALRNVIGDAAFFSLARQWAQAPGTRSLEEWMVLAQSTTRVNLLPFFQAWVYAPAAPAPTAANGFR